MDRMASGWINGFIGVVIFSGSLPATRVAVIQFDPVFLTVARAAIAGVLALGLLLAFREKRPSRGDLVSLVIVALGVVVGFPLADGAGAAAHHLGALHRLHRAAAAVDGDLRRAARRRAAKARILDILRARQRVGGRLRPDAGADGFRRSAMP